MVKEKKTIKKRISERKYKIPNAFLYGFLTKCVIRPFLQPKLHPTYNIVDNINDCKGPCFLIYNHQSRQDYIYIVNSCYPRRVNFVTGYNEFYRKKFKLIFDILNQIPKKNFVPDVGCICAMRSIIKQNGVVAISPEGMSSITGHNQPVAIGTGKLFKHYKIPVYMCKLQGAFLSNTKVCLDERYGKVEVTLTKLFDGDDFANVTPEEIENKCNEALWQDEFEWNKLKRYKYKSKGRIAHRLHDLCYRCPRCGKEFQMLGDGNAIKCLACGNGAMINDFYDFIPFDDDCILPDSPSKWVDEERKNVYHEIQDSNFEFVEHVRLGKLPEYEYISANDTSVLCGEGKITINHKGFFFKGTKDGKPFEFNLQWRELPTLGMPTDVTYFATYYDGDYYDFFPERPCVGKILLMVEEMHRMHSNAWKNFPWADTYD